MIFLHPEYLWGLLAIAIPIIIHLFRFRRYKTVYFSSIQILKAVKSETKKQSQLKHILVLISRILAVIALVIAFARPVLPREEKQPGAERTYITVYLDNSYSMQVAGRSGMLLSVARQKALDLAESYSPADRFRLITNDFNPARLRFTDKATFISQVEKTGISPVTRDFEDIQQRIKSIKASDNQEVYLISDFQKSTFSPGKISDSEASYHLVPVKGVNPSNLYIDSCWLTTPSMPLMQTSKLKVKIRNSGQKDYEKLPLKLKIDGEQRALSAFSIPAGGETTVTLSFLNKRKGFHKARIELADSPISFDNVFYFSYRIAEKVKVLEIYDEKASPYLKRLFGSDSLISFIQSDRLKLNLSSLNDQQLIILNSLEEISSGFENELREVSKSVDILLIPHPERILTNQKIAEATGGSGFGIADTSSVEITTLATEHPLMEGVFYQRMDKSQELNINLPEVFRHYFLDIDFRADVLMRLANGDPFLTAKQNGKANIYTLAVPLEASWSEFVRHPVFVPVIHRMAIISDRIKPLYYVPGEEKFIEVEAQMDESAIFRLVNEATGVESIPSFVSNSRGQFIRPYIDRPGHYRLLQDSLTFDVLSFNASPVESDLATFNTEELTQIAGVKVFTEADTPAENSFKKALAEEQDERNFWRVFVWITLLFLAIEVLLLRFL